MQSSLDGSSVDADAMDLYTSHPPSLGPEQLDATPFPSLQFSGNVMEALFPEAAPSIFDDTLAPVASTSGSTPAPTPARPSTSISANDDILPSLLLPHDPSTADASPAQIELDFDDLQGIAGSSSSQATAIPTTSSIISPSSSSLQLSSSKRGRGRPRKAPNAPTRSKYARITKEEMSEDDDNDRLGFESKSSTATPRLSSTTSATKKGKERLNSRNNSSSNSNSDATAAATTQDLKGKRPAHLLETRTKSGRTVHKPDVYVPTFEPSFRRRKLPQQRASTESLQCAVCGQGNSPSTNQIVLCDGCNTPYHQLCHDPSIPKETIAAPERSAWYCHQCELKRVNQFPTLSWEENVTVSQFPMEIVQAYLRILPQPNLVKALWDVIQHYPEARLLPPNLPQLVEADTAGRVQIRQARQHNPPIIRPSATPSLGESNKRKRQSESSSSQLLPKPSQPYYREGSNDEDTYTDTEARVAKAYRKEEVEIEEGGRGGRLPSSPAKGNATTQTDDYYPESDERGVRFPSHPEDRPGSMSYFEMLRNALKDINEPEGVPPRRLYEWISEKYALPDNFRPSAGQALQKAAKKGHFLKSGSLYRVNPEHENTKAVKRPVRKPRPSDASQSTSSTHQRNISNQTTASSRSTLTSVSNDGTHHQKSESLTEIPEILQGENHKTTRPPGISLEEVIARQQNNNNTSTSSNTVTSLPTNTSNPGPGNAFPTTTPSVRPSNSPLTLPTNPSPGIGNQYYSQQHTFDPAPRVHQRHRSSVSYGTARPFVDSSQASLAASQQQMPQIQQHPGSQMPVPSVIQHQRNIDPQTQMQGYGSSGDAGIDSMLADLMRQQSPAENMSLAGQHQRQQQIAYASIPVRPNDPGRQGISTAPGQPTLNPQQVQSRQQAQQQRVMHQQQLQPQMNPQQQQQLHHQQFQAQHPYISSHPTDPAIFTGGPPQHQYTQSHTAPPQMQGYNPQYGFQNVPQQQRAQQQSQIQLSQQQPHPQNQQVSAAALQAQYNRTLGQSQEMPRQE